VRCAAEQRSELEHLCRYITRPAIANERLRVNHAGQVVLELKTPYRDGTSHLVTAGKCRVRSFVKLKGAAV
jgi:hypothetical protein